LRCDEIRRSDEFLTVFHVLRLQLQLTKQLCGVGWQKYSNGWVLGLAPLAHDLEMSCQGQKRYLFLIACEEIPLPFLTCRLPDLKTVLEQIERWRRIGQGWLSRNRAAPSAIGWFGRQWLRVERNLVEDVADSTKRRLWSRKGQGARFRSTIVVENLSCSYV